MALPLEHSITRQRAEAFLDGACDILRATSPDVVPAVTASVRLDPSESAGDWSESAHRLAAAYGLHLEFSVRGESIRARFSRQSPEER